MTDVLISYDPRWHITVHAIDRDHVRGKADHRTVSCQCFLPIACICKLFQHRKVFGCIFGLCAFLDLNRIQSCILIDQQIDL